MNSDLDPQTQPTNPCPPSRSNTSARALETEEGLDALLLACSQQHEQELHTHALFLACRQTF